MPRPEDRDNIPEHRKLFTPADLLMLYVQEQKPVNSDALRVMIEPLAGTSFGTIALSALRVEFDAQQQRLEPKPYRFLPSQFYHAFFKKIDDSNIDNDLIGTEALHAENALWSFLSHNVAVLSIYPDERLASGEMMFWQQRHDHVWHDPEHERYAFTHDTGQWQFFHNGERVGAGVSVQTASWTDRAHKGHMVTVLAEGSPNGKQFFDARMTGIAALPRALQAFRRYTNILLVSDRFDFDAAVKKTPPSSSHRR